MWKGALSEARQGSIVPVPWGGVPHLAMAHVWRTVLIGFVLVLCTRPSLGGLADWADREPLLQEEDNLRLAQASIEMDWGQAEPVDISPLEDFAARGQELGETVLADLHSSSRIGTYILPDPLLYSSNRTVFVASVGGSLNSTTCGSIAEPCATLAQALALSDSVVLLPGDHIVHRTVAVRNRTSISIAGVMEDSMTRPRVILAHEVPPCPLLTLVEAGTVTLDSISFSDWSCNIPELCVASAVEVVSALECSLLNCHFKNNSKDLPLSSGNTRGCSFTYASVSGRELHMENCIVSDNTVRISPQGDGASVTGTAVTLFGANATLSNCHFANITGVTFNFHHQSPVSFYGAVYSLGSLDVRNCSFISTSHRCDGYCCSSLGGAIYNSARPPAPNALFIVSDSLFHNCLASAAYPGSAAGGALVVYAHTKTTIIDSSFGSNSLEAGTDVSLPLSGGSLFVSGVIAELQNCDFHTNTVAVNAGTSGNTGSGGAALFALGVDGTVTMQTCYFEGNGVFGVGTSSSTGSASFGGAVYCSGSVEARNCTFLGNSATGGDSELVGGQAAGGALMQFSRLGNATVTGCRFDSNEVLGGSGTVAALAVGGGAISVSGTFGSSHSVFSGNTATGGQLVVADSRFLPPRPGGSAAGGALLLQSDSELQWNSFEGNMVIAGVTTKGSCGAVAGGAVAASGGWLRINATEFTSNEGVCGENSCSWCTGVGGALAVANSFVTVHSSLFASNSVRGVDHGSSGSVFGAALGSLIHLGHLSCDVEDSTFSDNFISGGRSFGGAVFAGADSRFARSLFVANTATGHAGAYGGAIASRPNVVVIVGSSVVGNDASAVGTDISGGGAVYAAEWSYLWTEESLFIGNTAGFGGAIFFWSSGVPLSNYDYTLQGAFYDNIATELGGVTYFHSIDRAHGQTDCIVQGSGNLASCGPVCGGAVFQGVQLGSFQEGVWPGQSQNLEFGIVDVFGQVCQRNYYSAQIGGDNGTIFQSSAPQDQASSSSSGVFSIPGVQVFGSPGTVHKLDTILASTVLPSDWYPSFLLETEYHLRQCSPGHFLVSNSSCTPCDTQSYNFDGSHCVACPLSGQQCMRFLDQTTSMFQIVPGLYPTSFTNPVGLDACPFASSCPSYNCSVVPADDDLHWDVNCAECRDVASGLDCTCADGYTGRLCSECIFNEEQCYYRSNGQCANSATLPLGLWGPALEFVCYVVVTVAFFSLRQDAEKGTMKTLLFFVQTTAAFSGGVILPFGLIDLLASLTSGMVLNWLNVAALRCLSYDLFSSRVLVVSILALMPGLLFFPLVVLVHLVTLLLTDAYKSRKRAQSGTSLLSFAQSPNGSPQHSPTSSPRLSPASSPRHSPSSTRPSSPPRPGEGLPSANSLSFRDRLVDKCIHSALYIQYAAFFSICNILFVSWGCEKQASTGKWYAINMPWLQCGEGDWLRLLLATSALSLVCVVLPCCIFAYVLYQNRNALDDPAVIRRYGFLYGSYKRKFYFWELLALLRRLTLSFSLSAFAKSEDLYYCFPIAVHLISAACQIQFQPLHTKRENMMEVLAIFSVIFSFEASHRIYSLDSLVDFDTWFVELAVMFANGSVLFALLWFIGNEIKEEYRQKVVRYYGRLVGYGRQLRSFASFHGSL